jgi:predicted nucleic acid-binding protein
VITAIDTNVLLDLLLPGAPFGDLSQRALERNLQAGRLVISELVFAELVAHFPSPAELDHFLADTAITVVSSSLQALARAGKAWAEYRPRREEGFLCPRCGQRQTVTCGSCRGAIHARQHIVTDFVIGAHAATHADQLLTRDRGYYQTYFPDLRVIDPAAEQR